METKIHGKNRPVPSGELPESGQIEDRNHPITRELLRNRPHESGSGNCDQCNGTGFLFDPLGGGRDRGAFILCGCMKKICRCDGTPPYEYYDSEKYAMVSCPAAPARNTIDRIEVLQKLSEIPKRYVWKFISSIDYSNQSLLFAVDHSVETIANFGREEIQGLYFYGPTGCGKTLLSCAVLNELIRLYQAHVRYAKISRDILQKLKSTFNPNSELFGAAYKIERQLATVPVLVIDDFGVHRESDFVNAVLYDLIDARYEQNQLTIITSNEPMESWKEIAGGRVYSRLRQMCVEIHIEAPDYRLIESRSY